MPTSVRVDEKTEALLARAAQVSGKTKSAVIRDALRRFCLQIVVGKPLTPHEAIRKYIGCFQGPPDLAKASRAYLRKRLHGTQSRRAR